MYVLIADDDPGMRDVYEMAVEDLGYQPLLASDGEEAIQHLRRIEPILMIVDQQMPLMSGIEFIEYCRVEKLVRCPVLIISAGRNFETKAMAAGAAACLEKPFELDDLMNMIRRFAVTERSSLIA